MPRLTKDNWKPWMEERERFAKRGAQGFTAEIKALEQHIAKLREICPKDTAGYPHTRTLMEFDKLQQRLDEAKKYLASVGQR